MLARAAWIAVATLAVSLFVAGILAKFALLHVPCPTARCTTGQLHPASLRTLEDLGLSLDAFAVYTVSIDVIFAVVVWCAVAVLIFWRRSYDLMGLFVSLALLTFGTGTFVFILEAFAVRNHVSNILHKLQIADRAEAPAKPGSARMGLSDERY